jgi:hypothetical protein
MKLRIVSMLSAWVEAVPYGPHAEKSHNSSNWYYHLDKLQREERLLLRCKRSTAHFIERNIA